MSQGKWALISVYEKAGIVEFAQALVAMGWNILASGGTAKVLLGAGVPVKDVAELVGGKAILGHRVVTLSRELHAGLLAEIGNEGHEQEMESLGLPVIDMVVCDFYPMADAIAKPGATLQLVVEQTDIGGPTMVRSAAKGNRIVVCRVQDRQPVLDELKVDGDVCATKRQALRARAEFEVAKYCLDSARFHSVGVVTGMVGEKVIALPKGENGCQTPAGLYRNPANRDPFSLANFKVVDGADLSYNNLTDMDRLLQTLSHITAGWQQNFGFVPAIGVGVKHGNPCGAAIGQWYDSRLEAMGQDAKEKEQILHNVARAVATGDTRAIFGGLIMCNFPVTVELARELVVAGMKGSTQKFDAVIAPDFEPGAIDCFKRRGDKCRSVKSPDLRGILLDTAPRFRMTRGGDFLLQPNYTFVPDFRAFKDVAGGSDSFVRQIVLADAVCRTSNSNTVTIANDNMLLGNGVGQQDRVGAAELAVKRARDAGHSKELEGSVACSDSFFPFPDAVQVLIDAGVKAIFSTTGSVNDKLTQELCRERGVALYQLPDPAARGFFGH